jgi:UDP-glucose 4-epimerase
MRILLTGSSGWLGSHLAPRLRQEGHQVTGLDVAAGANTPILGSVADRTLIDRAFAEHGIEAVIHCAALHKPDIARYPPEAFEEVNVQGTANLLEAAGAAGHDRFLFTSTTSLMITEQVRAGRQGGATKAAWIDEDFGPLAPRNVYGATKLAAERLCHRAHEESGLNVVVLRTGRFFPEDDDTDTELSGPNRKANEFLNRRLTVEDCAKAHVAALNAAPALGFDTFIISAPPPFVTADCAELLHDAPAVIARYFPAAPGLYARRGWSLPDSIERVYDPSRAAQRLGFRAGTDFAAVLDALSSGARLPFAHDPSYVSPKERG